LTAGYGFVREEGSYDDRINWRSRERNEDCGRYPFRRLCGYVFLRRSVASRRADSARAAVLAEPTILPAAIVESLCGLALSFGAFAVFARWNRAWTAVFAAHAFALGGVLLGVTALALGAGPGTDLNTMYHRVMLVGLVAVQVLLLTPAGRATFRREA
jgi:hypothetical protein